MPGFHSGGPRLAPQQLYFGQGTPGMLPPQPAGFGFQQQLLPSMRPGVASNFIMPIQVQRQAQTGHWVGGREVATLIKCSSIRCVSFFDVSSKFFQLVPASSCLSIWYNYASIICTMGNHFDDQVYFSCSVKHANNFVILDDCLAFYQYMFPSYIESYVMHLKVDVSQCPDTGTPWGHAII